MNKAKELIELLNEAAKSGAIVTIKYERAGEHEVLTATLTPQPQKKDDLEEDDLEEDDLEEDDLEEDDLEG